MWGLASGGLLVGLSLLGGLRVLSGSDADIVVLLSWSADMMVLLSCSLVAFTSSKCKSGKAKLINSEFDEHSVAVFSVAEVSIITGGLICFLLIKLESGWIVSTDFGLFVLIICCTVFTLFLGW